MFPPLIEALLSPAVEARIGALSYLVNHPEDLFEYNGNIEGVEWYRYRLNNKPRPFVKERKAGQKYTVDNTSMTGTLCGHEYNVITRLNLPAVLARTVVDLYINRSPALRSFEQNLVDCLPFEWMEEKELDIVKALSDESKMIAKYQFFADDPVTGPLAATSLVEKIWSHIKNKQDQSFTDLVGEVPKKELAIIKKFFAKKRVNTTDHRKVLPMKKGLLRPDQYQRKDQRIFLKEQRFKS